MWTGFYWMDWRWVARRTQSVQVHRLISFTADQATQGVRGCVRTERNKGCPHLKKRPGPDGPSIPHVMSGPVQKSQYPSQERAVIGGAAPQKSLILTENGPFPQNFGACGGLEAGAPRRRHTSPAAARPSETGVVQPPRSDRENLLVGGLVCSYTCHLARSRSRLHASRARPR